MNKRKGCCLFIVGRILIAILVFAGVGWLISAAIERIRPDLDPITVLGAQSGLVLNGSGFGDTQGAGKVSLVQPNTQARDLQISAWSDNQITALLPADVQSGTIIVSQSTLLGLRPSLARDFLRGAAGLLPGQSPTEENSPWPSFRHDPRNTGRSPLRGSYSGGQPWQFATDKGIFSTPVIDSKGTIYFGSADHFFYALSPDGNLKWKFETGEIIDSAAVLGRPQTPGGAAPLTFISADGKMYHFRTDDASATPKDRLQWAFEAQMRPGISFNRWFEGNVAMGPDGTLYAGNTNFNYYAVNPDGTQKWVYATGSNNWSQAAFGADGSIYWGSLDTYIRAVSPVGRELWTKMTLGFVAASAAVGSDGTVYIGSFDSNLYALDPLTGSEKWHYSTGDHIYSSAALGGEANQTTAIYFGSADGFLYALSPNGQLLWKFDSGDTIRSSPAVGLSPEGKEIIYVGSGNGKLFALNAANGSLRWSFDSTPGTSLGASPSDAELRDRNDLNGSPALGANGVYIGGEHGNLVFVPYDYCLTATDPRCATAATTRKIADGSSLTFITPGGNALDAFPAEMPISSMVTLRLGVQQNGEPLAARLCDAPLGCPGDALVVKIEPAANLQVDHSADGRHIFIRPQTFLQANTAYKLTVSGRYYTGGLRLGNLALGGNQAGQFEQSFNFHTPSAAGERWPLSIAAGQTSAFEWTRLAAPLPTMLPSLNQIGFDYIDWIVGTVALSDQTSQNPGKVVLWAIGAKRDAQGRQVVDPQSDFTLPLGGSYQGSDFILSNQSFRMPITGINIPFNRLELRGQLSPSGVVRPGAALFADTEVMSIPKFGPYLVVAGLANNWYQKLLVGGTYVTRPYDGAANLAPVGITTQQVTLQAPSGSQPGKATASFRLDSGKTYPIAQHRAGILLVDPATLEIVFMDYHANLSTQADASGNLASVELNIPAGTQLPAQLRAYVLLDVYPVFQQNLTTAP